MVSAVEDISTSVVVVRLAHIGRPVLVLEDIPLAPYSALLRGEIGILVAYAEDEHIFIKFLTPHWDWPSQWRNELFVQLDDRDVIRRLKFDPHPVVLDIRAGLPQFAA